MVSVDVIHAPGVDANGEITRIPMARLHSVEVEPCQASASDGPHVLFIVPDGPGEYPLRFDEASVMDGTARVVTFVGDDGTNNIAVDGVIVVESISDTEVTMGVVADAEGFSVNGRFTASICPAD